MKRFALAIAGVLAIASIAVAVDLWDVPNEAASGQIKSCINSNNVSLEAAINSNTAWNAVIIATNDILAVAIGQNTPRFVGDIMINIASNKIYVSTNTTTNAWVTIQ